MTYDTSNLAALIRELDPDNQVDSDMLGHRIGLRLDRGSQLTKDMSGYVGRVNAGKTLTAERLAELLADRFDLEREN
ncbi:hypothetical protein [Paractinoplanes maris]|uniref:hypothetical protein n=1 Tax=Paractinoplanes maris TaxID=1734446 RepID=UPI002021C616|nr:hypothetical protein [Actinoplanes maris]